MENTTLKIEITGGKSKKTGKEWKGVKITIGDWTTLVFPKTKFETDYITKVIEANK